MFSTLLLWHVTHSHYNRMIRHLRNPMRDFDLTETEPKWTSVTFILTALTFKNAYYLPPGSLWLSH